MRALLLADDCNPEWPSWPICTYKLARNLAELMDVVVVTQIRNRENIEKAGFGKAEVVYLDTEWVAAPLYKVAHFLSGGSNTGMTTKVGMSYPSYLAFEQQAWKTFKSDLRSKKFDVVHRLSPLSPTIPSPLAKWSDVPFVIGPINGGLKWLSSFKNELHREREWMTHLRGTSSLLPYVRSTYAHCAGILAAFDHTIQSLPSTAARERVIDYPEVGFDETIFHANGRRPVQTPVTVLYVGRLVPYKLCEVVIRAFANSKALQQHRLRIVGDGPERGRLEEIVRTNQLEGCVEFLGNRKQSEVADAMRQAEIFAFPSCRELGAGAVLEAMACGMASVVADYGGPATLISPERGVKLALTNIDDLTRQMSGALESLVEDPARVSRLGAAAAQFATQHFPWDVKARKVVEIYDWATGKTREKPSYWT